MFGGLDGSSYSTSHTSTLKCQMGLLMIVALPGKALVRGAIVPWPCALTAPRPGREALAIVDPGADNLTLGCVHPRAKRDDVSAARPPPLPLPRSFLTKKRRRLPTPVFSPASIETRRRFPPVSLLLPRPAAAIANPSTRPTTRTILSIDRRAVRTNARLNRLTSHCAKEGDADQLGYHLHTSRPTSILQTWVQLYEAAPQRTEQNQPRQCCAKRKSSPS